MKIDIMRVLFKTILYFSLGCFTVLGLMSLHGCKKATEKLVENKVVVFKERPSTENPLGSVEESEKIFCTLRSTPASDIQFIEDVDFIEITTKKDSKIRLIRQVDNVVVIGEFAKFITEDKVQLKTAIMVYINHTLVMSSIKREYLDTEARLGEILKGLKLELGFMGEEWLYVEMECK